MDLNCNILKCQYGGYIFPQRYVICILTLLGVTVSFNLRGIINIAIVKMVVPRNITENAVGHQCPEIEKDEIHQELTGGTLAWTEHQQGLIMAAFFPGYILTQISGGILADKLGPKHVFSLGILISGILSIFTPLAIGLGGWKLFVTIRSVMGLCLGLTSSSISTILSNWAPIKERGILGAIITSGASLGGITSSLGTTVMIWKTWQLPFYVWAIASIIWYKSFIILCFSEPSQNPFISEKEAEMLERELGSRTNDTKFSIPWKKILSSKPVWAMVVCMVGHTILSLFVSTYRPKYMVQVLKSDITKGGTNSAMSYFVRFVSAIFTGCLSDFFVRKDIVTVNMCRKLFCAIGGILSAFFLILIPYMGCSSKNASVIFTMCQGSMGAMQSSLLINPTDLSKNFAGIIMSIAYSLGVLLYIPWIHITAAMTPNHTIEQWRSVMWIIATIGAISTLFFLQWGSGDRQDFDTLE